MTTPNGPPQPPAPPPAGQDLPAPPPQYQQWPQQGPQQGDPPPQLTAEDAQRLAAALDAERKRAKELEGQLGQLQQAQMTEQERAVAEAREAGRAEAVKAAGAKVAAAEFRAAAAGRLANPDGALELIDLSRLVDDNGDPDREAINEAVARLAAVPTPPPPGGRVPAGPREPAADGDFLRSHWTPRR
jgi:hypothetical protein